ncbi:PREDICTED: uncharacterized protein LOC109233756 [Nicotiana attenuata]|uniref:uncharacterized protein LOC109233756 n=1 Tax=Nicotiana attenuata TaxID=49451 RepID=UPI0009045D90|nr:PREDICTED: uncharacterized protein LOC109233756 [Nicotiana attenuata]
MNAVAPTLISGIAYATSAQEVWMDLQERLDKVNDTRCYNLHKEIATLNQGTASISVYYSKLKDLWDETESVVPAPGCDCVKTKEFIVHLRKQKVYQFLMGLNDSYSQARSQILMMKALPTVNQAYAMLMSDESQRSVTANAGILGSAPNANINAYDSTALDIAKPSFNPKFRKNYNIQCDFCKIKGHSKENCYKIIGYPQDDKTKRKGGAGAYNAMVESSYGVTLHNNHASQDRAMQHMPMHQGNQFVNQASEGLQGQGISSTQKQESSSSSQSQASANSASQGGGFPFIKEQYDQIMQILNTGPSLPTQANAAGTDTALLASSNSQEQEWIIDTGATNHMVSNVDLLTKSSLTTPSKPRRVLLPNGDVTQVTQIGDSHISDRSTIKEVLYVPQFKFNLLSVSKVTRELRCFASFYPDFCVFQDLFSGKVREIGREREGLYFLQRHGAKKLTVVALVAAGIKSRTTDITLWHKRLGHISTIVLRRLFPAKLASIADTINKCTVCPCAKQTRLPFPTSYTKSTGAFDLIHVDVWGPYKYATFDGNKYFLTVIDDFSRMIWLFLLKLKSDVCVVLAQFIVFVQTQFNKTLKVIRSDNGSLYYNRMPSSVLNGLSPFELLYGRVQETDKLLPRARPTVLIGFSDSQKGYILLDLESHCFLINRDVSFREDIFPFKDYPTTMPPVFLSPESPLVDTELRSNTSPSSPPSSIDSDHATSNSEQESSTQHQSPAGVAPPDLPSQELSCPGLRKSTRPRQAPIWMKDFVSLPGHKAVPYSISNYVSYNGLSPTYQAYLAAFSTIVEPSSFE